jgi:hypothetical protein
VKPKQKEESGKKTSKTENTITFENPVFERVVLVKEKDKETKYVVTEWTVKLRVGHFFELNKEQEVEKMYEPLAEGQTVKSLTVIPSGKFFNLVNFEVGQPEQVEQKKPSNESGGSNINEDPQHKFILNPGYLVCLIDDVYPVEDSSVQILKKRINKIYKKNLSFEQFKEMVFNFKFSNNVPIRLAQIGYGYHFLPVSYVLKLFKLGFEQFCTVVGFVFPNGEFVEFEERPKDYQSLLKKLEGVVGYGSVEKVLE